MRSTKVAIVEDQLDISQNIADILSDVLEIFVVAQYASAEDALKNLHDDEADIYIVDLGLPGINGVEFISQASAILPDTDFIVNTISENGRDLLNALSVGAVGYIIKDCSAKELIEGINTVAAGGGLISPRMARRLCHHFKGIGTPKKTLTKTETEVLNKLRSGDSYEDIANQSNVSLSTIQTHVKSIYKKLNVSNREDAVSTGMLFGMIEK